MNCFDQIEREEYRLIITRRKASEILVTSNGYGWVLPRVEILPSRRIAEQVTTEVTGTWGLNAYCLFTPDFSGPNRTAQRSNYAVMESVKQDEEAPTGMCWMPSTDFEYQLADPIEIHAIRDSFRAINSNESGSTARPFASPGWLKDLFSWTQEQLDPLGRRLSGNFRQFDAGLTFCLIRLETSGPAAWFKATGEPNIHERSITLCLARLFPGNLPRILGINPSWNGWLSEELSDATLAQCTEVSAWERVAENLAELQIDSIGKSCALLDAKIKDLRLSRLINLIPPFMSRMSELMAVQEKQSPPPLSIPELDFLGHRLREALLLLESVGFPDTLGHLDFNPGNIVLSPTRCVFLDWAEACVTNPFVTFEYLREHTRRGHPEDATAATRVATAYLWPWTKLLPPDDIEKALTVSPLIAIFTYAVAISGGNSSESPSTPKQSAYLRSLTRRMHGEAIREGNAESDERLNSSTLTQAVGSQPPV